ncbi:E3 ubiquitin-protein ligase MARCHF2-like [Dermacentor silvarum]|uniref:E3 ubiquitin-protein ligase MARCHF2-like n=1 Tax=Dermacentor silvarum TaxID=543639 RepID=UPI002100EF87|nr:E3 ubiquitin-protein ligase MARCHF2-like [Dermacentor silvarum]
MADGHASQKGVEQEATVETKGQGVAPALLEDSAGPMCRICYGEADEENGPLLEPCACKGSIAFTHKVCLETCLREWDTDKCKTCDTRIRPLWHFVRDARDWKDVCQIATNAAMGTGDVIVMVLAWMYASRILGRQGWIIYLLIIVMLFSLTIFWTIVEAARLIIFYEQYSAWRRTTTKVELILDPVDTSIAHTEPVSTGAGHQANEFDGVAMNATL